MNAIREVHSERSRLSCMIVCIGLFTVADAFLVSRAWFLEDKRLLVAMAVPLSQCSLAAIWASCSRGDLSLRFVVPLVATIVSWFVLTRILPWGIGEPASAGWALAIAIQTLSIVLMIELDKRGRRLLGSRSASEGTRRNSSGPPWTFELRTLMLWTTVIAVGFGFIHLARARWRWTETVADWEFMNAMPIIGVFNALVAVVWLWVFAAGNWRQRSIKAATALILVGLGGSLMSAAVTWSSSASELDYSDGLTLLVSQSVFVAIPIGLITIAAGQPTSDEISVGSPSATQ